MDPEKDLAYLREKVALLEKCLEYERLLKEMREAAPKEPVCAPSPSIWWTGPYTIRLDCAAEDKIVVGLTDAPGPNEWVSESGDVCRLTVGGGTG